MAGTPELSNANIVGDSLDLTVPLIGNLKSCRLRRQQIAITMVIPHATIGSYMDSRRWNGQMASGIVVETPTT
jgi:hypothetical protein